MCVKKKLSCKLEDFFILYHLSNYPYLINALSLSPEKNLWYAVTMQALLPLPRSLHMAVLIRKRVFSFGGLAPVISEDSSVPDHETK